MNLMSSGWVQQVHNHDDAAIQVQVQVVTVARSLGVNVTRRYQQEGLSLKRESVGTPRASTLRLLRQNWNKALKEMINLKWRNILHWCVVLHTLLRFLL